MFRWNLGESQAKKKKKKIEAQIEKVGPKFPLILYLLHDKNVLNLSRDGLPSIFLLVRLLHIY